LTFYLNNQYLYQFCNPYTLKVATPPLFNDIMYYKSFQDMLKTEKKI